MAGLVTFFVFLLVFDKVVYCQSPLLFAVYISLWIRTEWIWMQDSQFMCTMYFVYADEWFYWLILHTIHNVCLIFNRVRLQHWIYSLMCLNLLLGLLGLAGTLAVHSLFRDQQHWNLLTV